MYGRGSLGARGDFPANSGSMLQWAFSAGAHTSSLSVREATLKLFAEFSGVPQTRFGAAGQGNFSVKTLFRVPHFRLRATLGALVNGQEVGE
jgi:hypothetical protein